MVGRHGGDTAHNGMRIGDRHSHPLDGFRSVVHGRRDLQSIRAEGRIVIVQSHEQFIAEPRWRSALHQKGERTRIIPFQGGQSSVHPHAALGIGAPDGPGGVRTSGCIGRSRGCSRGEHRVVAGDLVPQVRWRFGKRQFQGVDPALSNCPDRRIAGVGCRKFNQHESTQH